MIQPQEALAVIGAIAVLRLAVVRVAPYLRAQHLPRWGTDERTEVMQRPHRDVPLMIVAVIIACAAAVMATTLTADARPCGEERAAVKLGLDPEAAKLSTEPIDTTIARLVALPRPGKIPEATRAGDVERMVWRTDAVVVAYLIEADGDFHVVIADTDGHQMIVEIPDPACASGGAWGPEISGARQAFLAMLSARGFPAPGKKPHRTSFPVQVSGLGFFDRLHGQAGATASGLELHPVLAIEAGAR